MRCSVLFIAISLQVLVGKTSAWAPSSSSSLLCHSTKLKTHTKNNFHCNNYHHASRNNLVQCFVSAEPREQESSSTKGSEPKQKINQKVTADPIILSEQDIASSTNEYSFFDEAIIYVRAGSGGQGSSTYKKGVGGQDGPPDGGNGGRGGNVDIIVDVSLNTLAGLTNAWRPNSFGGSGAASSSFHNDFRKSFRAENGEDGARQNKSGRYGKSLVVRVPPGTVVQELIDEGTSEEHLIDLGSLTVDSPSLRVASGGEGGEGSAVTRRSRGVRRPRVPPEGGERKTLKLTLKVVADVALVGVPNAGKSTLLAAVTRAKPKIANYPFTTVIPNLGVWIPPESDYTDGTVSESGRRQLDGAGSEGLVLCDVPGLIAGAADGVGLGHAFLRHVERCHVILHLVDATSDDPVGNFEMLNQEIMNYGSGHLARLPQVVVVNKIDILEGSIEDKESTTMDVTLSRKELETKLQSVMTHSRLLWMSAKEKDGVDDLMIRLSSFVKKVKNVAP